jgi:monovalent cation:H+ antiporter-2, CPA2 family
LPILAVTQPLLGGFYGPVLFALLLIALGSAFWKGATSLHGHVQAGAKTLVDALVAQARGGGSNADPDSRLSAPSMEQVHLLLPGLGTPSPVALDARSLAVGRSLAELNLRGITGATVLMITRGDGGMVVPTAREVLQAGDVLALAGTRDAIESARTLLTNSAHEAAAS